MLFWAYAGARKKEASFPWDQQFEDGSLELSRVSICLRLQSEKAALEDGAVHLTGLNLGLSHLGANLDSTPDSPSYLRQWFTFCA